MYICLIRAQTASIWWKNDQIWPKLQFLQVGNNQKVLECLFSGNKSPCGSALVRRKLLETYPNQINSFKRDFKKWHFPKQLIPDGIYQSKSIFYRKLKWSVWSIWTYSTRWIFKFVTQKVSCWRKLKIHVFRNMKNKCLTLKLIFEAASKIKMILK